MTKARSFEFYLAIILTLMVCTSRLSTAFGEIVLALACVVAFVGWRRHRKAADKGNKPYFTEEALGYNKAYCIFLVTMLPSVLFMGSLGVGFHEWFQWIWRWMPFVLILAFVHKRTYLVNMLWTLLIVFGFDCLTTLVQVMLHLGNNDRGWGFGGSQLAIASLMCILLPLAVVIVCDQHFEKRLKQAAWFTAFSVCIGLLCNKSRGSWISNIVLVPTSMAYYIKQSKKLLIPLGLVAVLIVGFFVTQPQYMHRFESISNTTTDRSNADRLWGWRSSIDMYVTNPVAGVGLGDWRAQYDGDGYKHYSYKEDSQGLNHAHNNFFMILSETGTIGFLGFLYWLGYFIFHSFNQWRKNKNPYDLIIWVSMIGYVCIFGFIEFTVDLSAPTRIFWFILGTVLALKAADEDIEDK